MTSTDLVIPVVEDEVTIAANALIEHLAARYEPMVEEASTLLMDISIDPVGIGLAEFNNQIGTIRNRSNKVAGWLMAVTEEKRKAQTRRDLARAAFEEKLQGVLANDPRVLDVDGQQAKLALARSIIERDNRVKTYSEQIYTRILGYHEALKIIHDSLAETARDLMRQYSVIKQQIALGEVDGSESTGWNTPGIGPAVSPQAQVEAAIAEELGGEGYVQI